MTIKKKVSVWFVSLKVLEATLCVGVKTKCPTRNPVCIREIPVKVCGVCPRRQKILGTALAIQVKSCKTIYLKCGERYHGMIDHRSYIHNSSSFEINLRTCKERGTWMTSRNAFFNVLKRRFTLRG